LIALIINAHHSAWMIERALHSHRPDID